VCLQKRLRPLLGSLLATSLTVQFWDYDAATPSEEWLTEPRSPPL